MGFAQRLKEAMDSTHTTMYRLSKILEVHPTTIKNWLDGKSEPKSSTIEKIATALDVSVMKLMDLEEKATQLSRDEELLKKIAFEFDMPPEEVKEIVSEQGEEIESLKKLIKVGNNIESIENSLKTGLKTDNRNGLKDLQQKKLYDYFSKLNDEGKQVAIERVQELTEIPRYQKDKNA